MSLMSEAFKGTIIAEKKPTTPEIEELRRLRAEAFDVWQSYDKQICQKYLEYYKVPDITGQWVRIHDDVKDYTYVGYVNKVERLFEAFRIEFNELGMETHRNYTIRKEPVECDFDWTQSKNIETITKEEALKAIRNKVEDILTKEEDEDN